ncbi:ABC-2 family transporter protein [Streptomyces sp. NPDC006552]|uniref:ABC transporter permease n=1 Tax=Streptomyces sp. NPDC006552 TaxID=3157179 RepID=UPI0033A963F4
MLTGQGRWHATRVAWSISMTNFRAGFEYRTDFLLSIALGVMWQSSVVVFATVLLTRFPGVGGWTSPQVLLLASMRMCSHGLVALLLGPIDMMGRIVREGRLDAYLLRPLPLFRQVQLSWLSVNALGDLIVAVIMFGCAVSWFDLTWTLWRVIMLVAGILGGFFMEGAVLVVMSSITMHFTGWQYWSTWLQGVVTMVSVYPLSILPLVPHLLLTYLLPVAFIAYIPAAVVTGHVSGTLAPQWAAVASPLIGAAAFMAARRLWNWSAQRYQGANG